MQSSSNEIACLTELDNTADVGCVFNNFPQIDAKRMYF